MIKRDADWQKLGTLWVSDGKEDGPGQIEIKLQLVENKHGKEQPRHIEFVDNPVFNHYD